MIKETEYCGIKILTGIHTHPGSGDLHSSTTKWETDLFLNSIEQIQNKENPVMVEVGCCWALWSLLFRKKYPGGKNILIELNKHFLQLAKDNFALNEYNYSCHWGGFFLDSSCTYVNKEKDIDYDQSLYPDGYKIKDLKASAVGPELNFWKCVNEEFIDLLHMDIQGSEVPVIKSLIENGTINNIDMLVVATHNEKGDDLVNLLSKDYNFKILFSKKYQNNEDGHFILKQNM